MKRISTAAVAAATALSLATVPAMAQDDTEPTQQSSGSSQGTIVGIFSGTLAAVLTTSLIVFSDPRGANKIIDMVNAQFGLGLPHLHTPKVQLPNF